MHVICGSSAKGKMTRFTGQDKCICKGSFFHFARLKNQVDRLDLLSVIGSRGGQSRAAKDESMSPCPV